MNTKRRVLLAVSALVLVAGAITGYSVWSSNQYPETPETSAVGREVYSFDDVATMMATSDLVVKATVTSTEPGRAVGAPDDGGFTLRNVHLDIVEIVYQRVGDSEPKTLVLEEEGWTGDKVGYVANGVQWSRVGDSGYYFLVDKPDAPEGHYGLIWSQGRVLITQEGIEPSGHFTEQGPWQQINVAALDAASLESVLEDAVAAVRSGEVDPIDPSICEGSPDAEPCQG